jgi:hypothetical protein
MKRARIPGTRRGTTLYVLPSIPDDANEQTKNVLAIRNACAVEGRCPACRTVGVVHADAELEGLWHWRFAHEPWCPVVAADEEHAA